MPMGERFMSITEIEGHNGSTHLGVTWTPDRGVYVASVNAN